MTIPTMRTGLQLPDRIINQTFHKNILRNEEDW